MITILAETSRTLSGIIVMAGVMIFAISALISRSKRKRSSSKTGVNHREEINRIMDVRNSIDKLFVNLQDFSRTTIARLDTKIRIVEQLLRETDEKTENLKTLIAEIERMGEEVRTAVKETSPVIEADVPDEDPVPEKVETQYAEVFALAKQGMSTGEISEKTGMPRGEIELVLTLKKRRGL